MHQQLLGSGALVGDEFLQSGGKAVEGAITAAQFWRDNPDPKAHAYLASLQKRTGQPPVLHDAYAYDGLLAMAEAIKNGGVTNKPEDLAKDRERIRSALDGIKVVGASGTWSLDAKTGEVQRPMLEAKIAGGQWHLTPISMPQ